MSQSKASGKAKNYNKVKTEINDLIDITNLGEIKDIELIDDYICELTDLLRNLRDKYEVLEDTMSNEDYDKRSFKHDEIVSMVKRSIKEAKSAKMRAKEVERERIRKEEREIRKEEREREDRIRKEELDKEERYRSEKEEKEERIRKEKEEKEERIKKEIAEQKVCDEMNACLYKFETLFISFPIADLESVDDIRSKVEKTSEYMAEYKFLIKKMKFIGMEDDTYQDNLYKMTKFINEGNQRMKAIRDQEYNEKENRKTADEDINAKKKEEEAKLKKEKEKFVVNRLLAEISLIENDFMKVEDIAVSDLEDSELLD